MAKGWDEIGELCTLCAEGKLYEVEAWIENGLPIQCEPSTDRKHWKLRSPLQLAVERGFYSLVELLLLNGYDPNGDSWSCLKPAVEAKNRSLINLLLKHGADPHAVDFYEVLETYDRDIMDRFIAAGVDPCRDNSVAQILIHKKRPHLGFIKQYGERFPGLLRQASIALRRFVEEGDEKGISLMLWLGASPHLNVPEFSDDAENESENEMDYFRYSALQAAAWRPNAKILKMLLRVPIPPELVQPLFEATDAACNPELTEVLLRLGADPNRLTEGIHPLESMIGSAVGHPCFPAEREQQTRALECIRLVIAAGARWNPEPKKLERIRRKMTAGAPEVVSSIVSLLRDNHVLTDEQLHELTRTPTMRRVLSGHGRPQKPTDDFYAAPYRPAIAAPTAAPAPSGYWKRHWSKR